MSGFYDLYESPCPNSRQEERKTKLHARPVNTKTFTQKDAIKRICKKCTLSSGDVTATLIELHDFIVENLHNGDRVCLDELGTFSISLKCTPATDRKKVRSRDVSFSHINFQPSPELNQQMGTAKFYRTPYSRHKLQTTQEERMALLNDKLATTPLISMKTYSTLTGLSEYASKKELARLVEEGVLTCQSSRHAKFYYKKGTVIE